MSGRYIGPLGEKTRAPVARAAPMRGRARVLAGLVLERMRQGRFTNLVDSEVQADGSIIVVHAMTMGGAPIVRTEIFAPDPSKWEKSNRPQWSFGFLTEEEFIDTSGAPTYFSINALYEKGVTADSITPVIPGSYAQKFFDRSNSNLPWLMDGYHQNRRNNKPGVITLWSAEHVIISGHSVLTTSRYNRDDTRAFPEFINSIDAAAGRLEADGVNGYVVAMVQRNSAAYRNSTIDSVLVYRSLTSNVVYELAQFPAQYVDAPAGVPVSTFSPMWFNADITRLYAQRAYARVQEIHPGTAWRTPIQRNYELITRNSYFVELDIPALVKAAQAREPDEASPSLSFSVHVAPSTAFSFTKGETSSAFSGGCVEYAGLDENADPFYTSYHQGFTVSYTRENVDGGEYKEDCSVTITTTTTNIAVNGISNSTIDSVTVETDYECDSELNTSTGDHSESGSTFVSLSTKFGQYTFTASGDSLNVTADPIGVESFAAGLASGIADVHLHPYAPGGIPKLTYSRRPDIRDLFIDEPDDVLEFVNGYRDPNRKSIEFVALYSSGLQADNTYLEREVTSSFQKDLKFTYNTTSASHNWFPTSIVKPWDGLSTAFVDVPNRVSDE